MKVYISLITLLVCFSSCHASLIDVMPDCCERGASFAGLGRMCDDLEAIPDIAPEDHGICMVIMKSCCANSLGPVLCERALNHRMNVGSCQTMSNDTCFSAGRECCDCCELGINAFHDGIECESMRTGTSCDRAFAYCCKAAASSFDENECSLQTSHRLCTERCVNLIDNYVCECHPGNHLLEDNITCVADGDTRPPPRYLACSQAPCQHECRQVGREYECYCRTGYELLSDGYTCEDVDECAVTDSLACNYAERCLNTIGSFNCISDVVCRSGLKYDPVNQYCVDIDECAERTDTCDERSICENRYASYTCQHASCPTGYYYDRTVSQCNDIDECARGTHECLDGARCDNLPGSFHCTRIVPCGTGYTINGVTQQCVDVDECSQQSHDCEINELCINIRGSYDCQSCPRGFKTNGNVNRCTQDINECQEGTFDCREGTRCENNVGSYTCISICMPGFEYNRILRACMDVDECRRGLANCATYEICQNTNGSFSCGCRQGFRQNNYGQCVDIDECREGLSECKPNQRCYNLQGQYQCRNMCRNGFRFNNFNSACEDIDECAEGLDVCQNNQRCINQEGGYVCQCPAGHQANRDRATCEDIDECSLGLCRGTCENLPGSYVCTCPAGYALMENNVTCKDLDECSTGTDTCIQDEVCFNTRGGHKCESVSCPEYYQVRTSNDNIQCVKTCPRTGNAPDCPPGNLNSTISHTFVALPSIPFLRQPIRLLTIGLPNYRSAYGGSSQTYFRSISGNEAQYFVITRLFPRGLPTGYVSLQKPISGPFETVLHLEIVTEVRNPVTRRTEVTATSYLMIHIDVGEQSY